MMPHLAEELWDHAGHEQSVFLSDWEPSLVEQVDIEPLLKVRSQLLLATEMAREHGVRSPAGVDICFADNLQYKGEFCDDYAYRQKATSCRSWASLRYGGMLERHGA
jgi:hypothetical protein